VSSWEHNEDEHNYIRAEEARERNEGLYYEEYHERAEAWRAEEDDDDREETEDDDESD
jgi:hypothetical protein